MKLYLFSLMLFLSISSSFSQVTIGSDTAPNENSLLDLNENGDGSSNKGLLFPRVALVATDNPTPLQTHVEGMIVYNTGTSDNSISNQNAVSPGTYYNDGTHWIKVSDSDTNPWYSSTTQTPAKSVGDDIYHKGTVALGLTTADASAQLEVASSNKGVLIPRLTKSDRDAIVNPANGLMIFNINTNCINYYNEDITRWMNLCGGYDPAIVTIDCNSTPGASGTFMEGKALNTENTYTITLVVTEIGTYQIVAKTNNGYSFSKSGLFTSTGTYNVVLEGQGAPIKSGSDNVTIESNGSSLSLSCTLPSITVIPASIVYTVNPDKLNVFGDYYTRIPLDNTNYIEIELNVTNPGTISITSASENGISFSSGALTLEAGVQTVKLHGQGTPVKPGTFTGNTITLGGTTLTPTVKVISTKGTFDDPVNRCQEILDEDSGALSNYYWIKDATNNKFMTYCLMDNGTAWTLVKSLSERQIITVNRTQSESIATQPSRNLVTSKDGVFNEYNFSLAGATVNNVGSSTGTTKLFKFSIKEQGHTTSSDATMDEVKNTTVSIFDDIWAPGNYWNVTTVSGNPATGNFAGTASNNTTEGKIFGKTLSKPSLSSANYYFDDIAFTHNPPGMYSQANFFTGFYGALGYVARNTTANDVTYTYNGRGDSSDGKTYTYNKYYINDLFGIYLNSEAQINHHIGTCSNSTDDFGGASYCNAGWANWRPHNFNKRPDESYEGRIIQYWVK